MSYTDLDQRLTGRNRCSRKVANNTYAIRRGDDIAVRLHSTDVVTFHPDGSITLRTGGWLTVTTKDRMNSYLPSGRYDREWCPAVDAGGVCDHDEYGRDGNGRWLHGRFDPDELRGHVYSVKGRWMVSWATGTYAYNEGMTLHPDGTVTGALDLTEVLAQDERNRTTRKAIKAFIDSITPEQIVTAFENPGGDCLGCRQSTTGEFLMEHCLESHVEEHYFHGHLAKRAVIKAGYQHPDVIMSMIYADAQRGRVDDTLKRSLRKLLVKSLIEGVATR